jgi:hypothetical protein
MFVTTALDTVPLLLMDQDRPGIVNDPDCDLTLLKHFCPYVDSKGRGEYEISGTAAQENSAGMATFFAIVALIQHTNYYYKTISYIYLGNIT